MFRTVYITPEQYDAYETMAELVEKAFHDGEEIDLKKKFLRRFDYPTIEALEEHQVKNNMAKYLPYLIYYMDYFDSEEEEYLQTKAYIRDLMYKYVFIGSQEEIDEERERQGDIEVST